MARRWFRRKVKVWMLLWLSGAAVVLFGTGCGGQKPTIVLRINGEEIEGTELNLLAVNALAKSGLIRGSLEGDLRLKDIADEIYNSLITIYVIRQAAERELEPASEDVIQKRLEDFIQSVGGPDAYQGFLKDMNLGEKESLQILSDQERFERYQQKIMEEGRPELSDDDIKAAYYSHAGLYKFPNRARISHILFAVAEDAGPEDWRDAKDRATQVRRELTNGDVEGFARAAQAYSQDLGSGPRGGDLGFVSRTASPTELMDAVFTAPAGEIAGPVQSQHGFHLALITDREMSFDEAREEVRRVGESEAMALYFDKWLQEQRQAATVERLVEPMDYFFPELARPQ